MQYPTPKLTREQRAQVRVAVAANAHRCKRELESRADEALAAAFMLCRLIASELDGLRTDTNPVYGAKTMTAIASAQQAVDELRDRVCKVSRAVYRESASTSKRDAECEALQAMVDNGKIASDTAFQSRTVKAA
jgi:hypothetical protein